MSLEGRLDLMEKANITVQSLGTILTAMKSKEIHDIINEFSHAEAASVIFDAQQLEGQKIYPHGRREYWDAVTFKKQFFELLLPIIEFLEEERKKYEMGHE